MTNTDDRVRHAAVKLTIPTSVLPTVARPHLHERLDGGNYQIGVVSAPAGFGKTSLLSTWARANEESTAWLSCNQADAEPTRFWGGLLSAVDARWPGVGDDAAILLQRDSPCEDLATALANDMGEADVPMAIVIDDFHQAPRTPAVFGSLVSMLPSNVRVVLGTRVHPQLPLGRLRVAGSLLELHTDELCFSPEETAAALELNGVATDPKHVNRLHDLTEGWPAGVQLATLAMRQATHHGTFLDAFGRPIAPSPSSSSMRS